MLILVLVLVLARLLPLALDTKPRYHWEERIDYPPLEWPHDIFLEFLSPNYILLKLRTVNGHNEKYILQCRVAAGVIYPASAASHFRLCGQYGHRVQHYLARI